MKKISMTIIAIAMVLSTFAQKKQIEYQKIVQLIEKTGYTVFSDETLIYKKMTFIDSKMNVHEIRLGGFNMDKIIVDSYYHGDRSVENFFGWEISPEGITPFPDGKTFWQKNRKAILLAYKELIK